MGIFLAVFIAGIIAYPMPRVDAVSRSIPDLQKRKEALDQKIKNDQAAKQKKQEEQKRLEQQIGQVDDQIDQIHGRLDQTHQSIATTQKNIEQKNREIATQEENLVTQQDHQNETLRVIYETGSRSSLEVLVGTETVSDAALYHDYLDALEGQIEHTMEEIHRIKTDLEGKRGQLQKQKTDLLELQGQQQAYTQALSIQKQEKDRLLSNAQAAEQALADKIAEAQTVYKDVNSELAKLEEAARQRALRGGSGKVSDLGFSWPLASYTMNCTFGCRTPFQSFHTGLDLGQPQGTAIMTVGDGTVSHIGRLSYGYGNFVVVTHSDRYATLYGHMMNFAPDLAVGQSVGRGQVLGYIGMSGWTTGPHLHLEVRDYGVPVDPNNFLP